MSTALIACTMLFVTGCSPDQADSVVAIVDATVIPMDAERVLLHHTVIIRDGQIVALGPASTTAIPTGARRIDGAGRYVLPGFTDAHVHLRDTSELASYLAHGVTSVVHLSGPTGSVDNVLNLRTRIATGGTVGPTIYTTGFILDGDPPIFPGVSVAVTTPEEAARAVAAQLAAGADGVKIYNNITTPVLAAVRRAADSGGVLIWGHVPRIEGRAGALGRALAAGLDVVAHGEEIFFTDLYAPVEAQLDRGQVPVVSDSAIAAAVAQLSAHGAAVIPNLSFIIMTRAQLDDPEGVWNHAEARYLAPAVRAMWSQQAPSRRPDLARFDLRERGKLAAVQRLTRSLQDAGVALLLGTDASAPGLLPGYSAWLELEALVAAGLTPWQALATATRIPGALLAPSAHQRTPFGIVATGQRADLVLLEADPLTDVGNVRTIVGVIVAGRWFDRAALEAMRTPFAGVRD